MICIYLVQFEFKERSWKQVRFWTRPTVSRTLRKYHKVSSDRLELLKQKNMRKCSKNKMMWGVKTYKEWRDNKLSDISNCDELVLNSNLDQLDSLMKENLEYSLCMFITEVRKLNGDDYPGKTLYQLTVSIQRFLNEKGLNWKLVDGPDFKQYRIVLDNIMKKRAQQNVGTAVKQAQLIPLSYESSLWEKGILGEHTPDLLRDMVLFLLGIHCGLRAGDKHYDLLPDVEGKPSQLSF